MNGMARLGCGMAVALGVVLTARADGPISFGPGGASPPAVQPGGPPLQTTILIGTARYLRGLGAQDMTTAVEGGATGSAAIMWQVASQGATEWFLIEGNSLQVRRIGDPNWTEATTTWGEFVVSRAGGQTERTPKKDGRRLTGMLITFYRHTEDTAQPLRHAPFLTGAGWDRNCGATYEEARQALRALDLKLEPNVPAGIDPNSTYVASQEPCGGTPLGFGDTVKVELKSWADCPKPDPGQPKGEWSTPISILAGGNGQIQTGTIEARHCAALATADCGLQSREFCFVLPPEVCNKQVTLVGAPEVPDQAISVYVLPAPHAALPTPFMDANGNHACARGVQPAITFPATGFNPANTRLIVAVERADGLDTGPVAIIARWQ